MDDPRAAFFSSNATSSSPVHHIISGSFRSISLFLLAFSPLHRTLSLVQTVDAFGPHQYLATNPRKDRVYTTSWALPPVLSSWIVDRHDGYNPWRVSHLNSVPITATSSYVHLPAPYTHLYSAGGPTGEVHSVDPSTGGFGEKIQEVLFVPEEELEGTDKTRVALRYGAHGVEASPASGHVFIPSLGTNSIEMYTRDPATGLLTHIFTSLSPRGSEANDGTRHVKVHPNGKVLYAVTEHTNYVDSYSITGTSLIYISSRSLLPPNTTQISRFRGDTLLLVPSTSKHPTPPTLFATTRGSTTADKGWLSVFSLDSNGHFSQSEEYHETPTSGGKANAIDILSKSLSFSADTSAGEESLELNGEEVWIVLTDDDDHAASANGGGGVRVYEWDGWGHGGVKEVARWPTPSSTDEAHEDGRERMQGGSHAIWLD